MSDMDALQWTVIAIMGLLLVSAFVQAHHHD